jgi:hypothetical protein
VNILTCLLERRGGATTSSVMCGAIRRRTHLSTAGRQAGRLTWSWSCWYRGWIGGRGVELGVDCGENKKVQCSRVKAQGDGFVVMMVLVLVQSPLRRNLGIYKDDYLKHRPNRSPKSKAMIPNLRDSTVLKVLYVPYLILYAINDDQAPLPIPSNRLQRALNAEHLFICTPNAHPHNI